MTPENRKSLAQQIVSNPLYKEIIADMEARAIESLIHASETDTVEARARVKAIRTFRADLGNCLNTRERKGAPA